MAHVSNGKADSALIFYKKAIEIEFKTPFVDESAISFNFQIANSYFLLKDYEKALGYIKKALDNNNLILREIQMLILKDLLQAVQLRPGELSLINSKSLAERWETRLILDNR